MRHPCATGPTTSRASIGQGTDTSVTQVRTVGLAPPTTTRASGRWRCRRRGPRGGIAPSGDWHLQATARDARGRKHYRYHDEFRAEREAAKFEDLQAFGLGLARPRRVVQAGLGADGLSQERVVAVIGRLLDTTLLRVGNEEHARTNRTYGLTTLRARRKTVERGVVRPLPGQGSPRLRPHGRRQSRRHDGAPAAAPAGSAPVRVRWQRRGDQIGRVERGERLPPASCRSDGHSQDVPNLGCVSDGGSAPRTHTRADVEDRMSAGRERRHPGGH